MTITAILTMTVTTATQLIALELLPLLQERLDLYQVMMSVRALDFSWVKAKSYRKQSSSSMNSFSNLLFFFFFVFVIKKRKRSKANERAFFFVTYDNHPFF